MFIGIDIVEIKRIKGLLDKGKYIEKVFTQNEIALVKDIKERRRIEILAGRFTAKEAAVKALGTGFAEGILLTDIETIKDEKGKPLMFLYNKAKEKANTMNIQKFNVSISHCKDYAVAMVVFEGETNNKGGF
ncbi:holo-ACP synthase [Clostridium formicaceticum]|uniref:Holo-[acyl-carrier-protein] synthase n=1 Tax=Clostridium formicaceticum TaxID=1497 RepID=A0AAC9RFS7_9CLOT|nr:holo-ACP synthase [Clostridium formicaceticum]AOY75656.1 holo-[acyl-carrier-protein] synthase [Clostridium formicaceticum]ARE85971.1 Holo-[acyl-carrier-protein] synthase [Clostridium formicaceticum]